MRREWNLEDLIECWTLDESELKELGNKSGATRLGFALMLKYFELEGRFPRREDVPRAAVEYLAKQAKVAPELFADYPWTGSSFDRHKADIRKFHRFRVITVGDENKLASWLATKMCPTEMSRDRLRAALLARCRKMRVEPPKPAQVERLLGSAETAFERQFTTTTMNRLSKASIAKLEELITTDDPDSAGGQRSFLQELKEDPGPIQVETLLGEITNLERVKAVGLPVNLFEGVSEKIVAGWRARAMKMYPSDFATAEPPVRLTCLPRCATRATPK